MSIENLRNVNEFLQTVQNCKKDLDQEKVNLAKEEAKKRKAEEEKKRKEDKKQEKQRTDDIGG